MCKSQQRRGSWGLGSRAAARGIQPRRESSGLCQPSRCSLRTALRGKALARLWMVKLIMTSNTHLTKRTSGLHNEDAWEKARTRDVLLTVVRTFPALLWARNIQLLHVHNLSTVRLNKTLLILFFAGAGADIEEKGSMPLHWVDDTTPSLNEFCFQLMRTGVQEKPQILFSFLFSPSRTSHWIQPA